jgi:hypothetical protein
MPGVTAWGVGCLGFAVVFNSTAMAQEAASGGERAPIPAQVLAARTVLIGNGGGQSYGAESYFQLTKYEGGPNRAYDSFYKAIRSWGHFELVESTAAADLLLVIRFTNPVVSRGSADTGDQLNDWVYDPQLDLSINDPRSGLPLWAITEHIEPGGDRATANRRYDEAVARLVDDLQRLVLSPEVSAASEVIALPPGAIAAEQRRQRGVHAGIGMLLGALAGEVVGSRSVNASCDNPNDLHGCRVRASAQMRNQIIGTVSGSVFGALLGWMLPVHF